MKNVLCFGDSNTYGFDIATYDSGTSTAKRMPFDIRWPGRIQLQLGQDYRIIEEGLNGRTIMVDDPFMQNRKGIASFPVILDCQAPLDLVIIHIGVNELKAYFGFTAGMIARGIENLVLASQISYNACPVPKVLIVTPPPVGKAIEHGIFGEQYGPLAYEKSLQFDTFYQKVAEKYHCGYLNAGTLGFELNPVDELHYSPADHARLADAIAPIVKDMIG